MLLELDMHMVGDKCGLVWRTVNFRTKIPPCVRQKWQSEWEHGNAERPNKLFAIKPKIGPPLNLRLPRRDAIVYRRLRIGHSYITHSWMLKSEPIPWCIGCDCEFTIEHILLNCAEFIYSRRNFFNVPDLKTLFETVPPSRVIEFVKDIGLFYKI